MGVFIERHNQNGQIMLCYQLQMEGLLVYLTTEFVGGQYVSIVQSLLRCNLSLNDLLQQTSLSFQELTDHLKYLIKQNIVSFHKTSLQIVYTLQQDNILYFQRIGKYLSCMAELLSKEELTMVEYLMQNKSSTVDKMVRDLSNNKKSDEERYKKTFEELIKKNLVYEDQKAADLELVESKPPEEEKSKLKKQVSQVQMVYYTISYPRVVEALKNKLLAQHLSRKYKASVKEVRAILSDSTSPKYPPPLDYYSTKVGQQPARQNVQQAVKQQYVEQYVLSRFGQQTLLVYKTLLARPYVDEKQLMQSTLLEKKPLGQALNPLLKVGLAKFYEMKVERVNTLIYFVSKNLVARWAVGEICQIIVNLHCRSAKMQKELARTKSELIQKQIQKLQASLYELDDRLLMMGY